MNKTIRQYYKQRQHGGRGTFARIVDSVALHAVAAAAGYLWFRYYVRGAGYVFLLTSVTTLLFFIAMRLWSSLRFDRFVIKESRRLTDVVLRERLLLLPAAGFQSICEKAAANMEHSEYGQEGVCLWCAQQATPVREDTILEAYRGAREIHAFKLLLCSLSPLSEEAAALLGRLPVEAVWLPQEALLTAARETAGYAVDDMDVEAYIRSEIRAHSERRIHVQAQPFAAGNAKKYLLLAALLIAASFIVGYKLYYRLLAGACLALFSLTLLLKKSGSRRSATEDR